MGVRVRRWASAVSILTAGLQAAVVLVLVVAAVGSDAGYPPWQVMPLMRVGLLLAVISLVTGFDFSSTAVWLTRAVVLAGTAVLALGFVVLAREETEGLGCQDALEENLRDDVGWEVDASAGWRFVLDGTVECRWTLEEDTAEPGREIFRTFRHEH